MTAFNLINILTYAIQNISMGITYIVFSIYIFGGKLKKNIFISATLIFATLITATCGEFYLKPLGCDGIGYLDTLSSIIHIITVCTLITDIKKSKLLLLTILFSGTIDLLYSYISPTLPNTTYIESLAYIIIHTTLILAILRLSKTGSTNILPEVVSTVPRWIIIFFTLFAFVEFFKETETPSALVEILEPFSVISVIVCAIYFIFKIFHLTYQQNEILKQMHDQKEYSEKMLTGDENLRRFRHDYRNHMIVINSLLESGRTDRAREYLNNMNSDINSTLTKISTGNFISDAIINNKAVAAAEHDISIKFTGQVIPQGIADEDLCTVLANILDNAIEATQKLSSNRIIRIDAAIRNGLFIMNVSNHVETEVKIKKDGTIKTSKKNQSEHGFGIKNVQKAVKKYSGTVSVTCENKVFSVDIMMKPII